jgi:hypothetical protein
LIQTRQGRHPNQNKPITNQKAFASTPPLNPIGHLGYESVCDVTGVFDAQDYTRTGRVGVGACQAASTKSAIRREMGVERREATTSAMLHVLQNQT